MRVFLSLIIIFSIGFVSAFDISCPSSIEVEKEFSCSIDASDLEGIYDVKVELVTGGKTIARVWNPDTNSWRSSYYYVQRFIEASKSRDIKIIISSEGSFDGVLKLRKDKKVLTKGFSINVGSVSPKKSVEKEEKEEPKVEEKKGIEEEVVIVNEKEIPKKIILLNSVEVEVEVEEMTLVYQSNGNKSLEFAPYVFSIFLIVIVVLLLREKF